MSAHGRQCIIVGMTPFHGPFTHWFGYHAPANSNVASAHDEIRSLFTGLAEKLDLIIPGGPASSATHVTRSVLAQQDKGAALLKLREAMYAANAALACNATDTYPDEG